MGEHREMSRTFDGVEYVASNDTGERREMSRTFDGVEYVAPIMMHRNEDGSEYTTAEDGIAWDAAITDLLVKHGARGPEAVKWLRKACRLKQEELATRMGLNRITVRRWEAGEVSVPVAAWTVLARLWSNRAETEALLQAARTGPQDVRVVA